MPRQYPWPTAGLQQYSIRLKKFIHERCTCYPPLDDDLFEVPEFMIMDPIKRRPSKFRLSFADDFPYTRFKDHLTVEHIDYCDCDFCKEYGTCNWNLRPFAHFVLWRDDLPKWIQRNPVVFKDQEAGRTSVTSSIKSKGSIKSIDEKLPSQQSQQSQRSSLRKSVEDAPKHVAKKISAFSFDDDPTKFPYL